MSEIIRENSAPNDITLHSRAELTVGGVTEVVSFDDTSVMLKTTCGELEIDGENLKVASLDTQRGVVAVNGKIQALTYFDKKKDNGRGVLGRIFG